MMSVSAGDRVVSGGESLLIRLGDDAAVLLASDSEIEMRGRTDVVLNEGSAALGYKPGTAMTLGFQALEVTTGNGQDPDGVVQVSDSAAQSALVSLQKVSDTRIRVSTLNEGVALRNTAAGVTIALVKANEALDLVLNEAGTWVPAGNPFRMQEEGTEGVDEDERDRRRGAYFWESAGISTTGAAAIGAGALVVGGVGVGIWYDDKRDDDRRDRDDDKEASPIMPPPEQEVGF